MSLNDVITSLSDPGYGSSSKMSMYECNAFFVYLFLMHVLHKIYII